jgi:PDZ domain-containing protein
MLRVCARGEQPSRQCDAAYELEGQPVSLFTDIEPDQPRRRRGGLVGWSILLVAILGIGVVALVPAPYVIEQPGPVFDTLSDVQFQGKSVPMIDIPSQKTYPTSGSLDMLTVTIQAIYPLGESVQDSNKQGAQDMVNSQRQAVAAALTDLGYRFDTTLIVSDTSKGYPAAGVLKANDTIVSLNGETFKDVNALRAAIAKNGTSKPATMVIKRGGKEQTVQITPVLSADTGSGAARVPVLGIIVGNEYNFPFDVKIQLENVGGPSAGMMFALGIIDKLTPGALNGGQKVAGTGTIDASGVVGPIGGIRQKMYGARAAGASWFLAPKDNCDEVVGHVPSGLTVYSTGTLKQSLTALKAISTGKGRSALPVCTAP